MEDFLQVMLHGQNLGNSRVIKDRYNNLIKDFEGLRYSYIFSPIRFKIS
ncbi:hypothetical protein SAMN02983004_01163 [Borreliella japonica]|uniref:Outer surface lipoprotein BB0158 domain-containing protein n=1 Tax=Borreliella japonica TaxID=34095 RepID=A0A1G4QML8_BORJA|nr:hypothetical protein SAMN02983004_01163 [Borreliella japonica]